MKQNNPREPEDSYYPALNAKSDLFFEIQYLVKQCDCEALRQVAMAPTRKRNYGVTPCGRLSNKVIVAVDLSKRDRIVKTIRENLKDGSPYRLTTEEWQYLYDLTSTYLDLDGHYVSKKNWERVKEVLNRYRQFYNPEPIKFTS